MLSEAARRLAAQAAALVIGLGVGWGGHAFAASASWSEDLTPIEATDWGPARAAHLLERAGFGATPEEVAHFAALTPAEAVASLVQFDPRDDSQLPPFDHSDIHDAGLEPFPPSRPATTELAKAHGEALGVKVKPSGNRPLQPVVNRFFYWLRASMLETDRLAYWWAHRMLTTKRPLQEKMALFWHGHFAVSETKVRDCRKLWKQLDIFHQHGAGNFRELLIAIAQDPAMLAFLDAGVNVKGAPNENFAREIMELFAMGVGNYSERDIREAARAFTGWNYRDLTFVVNRDDHDAGEKTLLGRTGRFDGVDVIDIILDQPVTADYIAGKIYRYFVREEQSEELRRRLGAILRDNDYELRPLLRAIFLSRDFYSPASTGTHIKSPVQLVISTYRKLGLTQIPGIPDFNETTTAQGQHLFHPPTVAGWPQGRSWITPGLLLERGNFARRVVYPDIGFVAHDRRPPPGYYDSIGTVDARITEGLDISAATNPGANAADGADGADVTNGAATMGTAMRAESNAMVDRDEAFNTRYASYRGWQLAIQRVKPIPRHTAQLDLAAMVRARNLRTTEQVVDYFLSRLLLVPVKAAERQLLVDFLTGELGTADVRRAESYLEDSLRLLVHLIMSTPEYQLG